MNLQRAASYVRLHRGRLFVVKIGGACLARPSVLLRLASELALVEALGARLVVVHGAGPQSDRLQREAGEEPRKIGGRRVTTPIALSALRRATLGELTSDLAAALTAEGTRALGLCAGSAGLLVAARRPPISTDEGVVDFGAVGDVVRADAAPLLALVEQGIVPVLSPPASDGGRGFLNVNADLAAAHLAVALRAHKLVLVTSEAGVLRDPTDPGSLASTLALEDLDELARLGALRGGMEVKTNAIRLALTGGVERVHVVSGIQPEALLDELYTTEGSGTLVTSHSSRPEILAR